MNLNDETSDTGFDIDAGVDSIASGIGLGTDDGDNHLPDDEGLEDKGPGPAPDPDGAAAALQALDPPKSWAADKHELWKTLPRDAQDYYNTREKQFLDGLEQYKGDAGYAKQLRDVITPYMPMLKAQGVSEADAINYLFSTQYQLTNGTAERRAAAYKQLGIDLGFDLGFEQGEQEQIDPAVKELRDQVRGLQSERQREQARQHAEIKSKADKETSDFASDPANAHFNEVAKDMVPFVQMGLSLKDAYDKAVWANPVTRAKEVARLQTEEAAKLKANAKTEGEKALRAKGVNVNSAQTRRAPTEPKGKFLDDSDMRDTLKSIRERAH